MTLVSREDKELLAEAIEEKKRRIAENGIRYYIPLDPDKGQNDSIGFHRCTARTRAIFGGNRSSKTYTGAAEATWYATGTHPYKNVPIPNYGRICCTDFTNGIEKVIIPQMRQLIPKALIDRYMTESRTLYLKNGSTIEFMSYDQDVEKFASASRHWIWFDEEPPQDIYRECQMRLLDTKGDCWFTLTPTNGMTWIYTDIYEKGGIDPGIQLFQFDTRQNPYIDAEVLKELAVGFSEAEIDMRFGGKFVSLSGLIYKEFVKERHIIKRIDIAQHWPKICAIDPHPRNPSVVVYMAVAPAHEFIAKLKLAGINITWDIPYHEDIYTIYDEIYPGMDKKPLISEICSMMRAKEKNDHIRYRLIDSMANTPDPIIGRTIRQEFETHGIRTVLAEKNVANRIFKVREKLQRNSLYVISDLHNTIWEFLHYVWDDYKIGRDYKDPKEKPRKKRDHAMDCVGYMCSSCPKFESPVIYRPKRPTVRKATGY
jgi:phage terminase large subunit-like protein